MTHVRPILPEVLGAITSASAGITAWQAQAQWGISVLAGLVAIATGVFTIRSLLRKERRGEDTAVPFRHLPRD